MQQLTDQGLRIVNDLAQRYGVSSDAVMTMLDAVIRGNGTMAQFSHSELGGSGQWMMGGMTMVGDMFNYGLKSKVDGLCIELSNLLANQQSNLFKPPEYQNQNGSDDNVSMFVSGGSNWWPSDLGIPSSTGAQNNVRYAYFPQSRRLAVEINGQTTVYDTQEHQIGGVSQQQGGNDSLTFTSQYGLVRVDNLPIISSPSGGETNFAPANEPLPVEPEQAPMSNMAPEMQTPEQAGIFDQIRQLSELHEQNILTDEEFTTKKTDLLARL